MTKGKRWTQEENRLLREMLNKGMTAEQIYESGKFPDRTFMAIQNQMKRLGFIDHQKKNFSVVKSERLRLSA
jgi:hypothetical protein